jgi:hypothetical protein
MKKAVFISLVFICTSLLCSVAGFRLGRYREHRFANALMEGSFINNLTALEKLRAGDTASTANSLETHVFLNATFLLNDPAPGPQKVMAIFRRRLVAYRQTYRANPAEWSPREQELEELLRKSK